MKMSTTPNAVVAPNPVSLYEKRILPAKLDNSKKDHLGRSLNALFFGRYLQTKGLSKEPGNAFSTLSPQQISDLLYQATVDDCEKEKPELIWAVAPKTLTKRAEKGPSTRQDTRTAGDFEAKVRQSEEADKAQRAQEAAKKRATELVDRFAPINHRRGVLNFELRDSKQAEWRKRIAEAKNFEKLEVEIAKEQRDIYTKLERAAERV
jgi:hypothetical protein